MTETSKELSGRIAMVTGAGRNIGRMIALTLSASGAAIAVNVRSNKAEAEAVVKEIEADGGKAAAFLADISDPTAVEKMASDVAAHFGHVDFLINNAALRAEKPFEQMTFADWRHVMGITLDGPFHCVKAFLPLLKRSSAGAIVNIGGLSADTGARDRAHVIAAKAGLVGFTRALAHDLSEFGITANLVSPGLIGTRRPAGIPEPHHHSTNAALLGHRGKPQDIAYAVRYLCSPGARFITGQQIHVNGGSFFG
jgi:3-oxoacyl-[acyl-carrier protein] reductase